MGSIRQTYIKRVVTELLQKHPDKFTGDFRYNVEMVKKLTDVNSKELRNKIAGYITSIKNRELKRKQQENT